MKKYSNLPVINKIKIKNSIKFHTKMAKTKKSANFKH